MEFERMLGHAENGTIDVVVAWHADRLARKVTDLERVVDLAERTGLRIATVSGDLDLGSDAGRLVARILVSVARGETERKGARQRRANQQRAEAGLPRTNARRSFGYEQDGMTVREDEAVLITDAYATVLAGGSIYRIAKHWQESGVPTMQGGMRWREQVIRQILLNPRNAGLATYRGEVVGRGTWPAITDEATWDAARVLLTDPSRRVLPTAPKRTRLLSGLMLCGSCEAGETVKASSRSMDGAPTYVCRTGKHLSRVATPIDEWVGDRILERMSRPDAQSLLADMDAPDSQKLRREVMAKRKRRDTLAVEYASGAIGLSALRAGTQVLDAEIENLERRLVHQDRAVLLPLIDGDPAQEWKGMDVHRKRAVITALCTVTAHPIGRGHRDIITRQNLVIGWHQA
jgi:DNA invertase Pin-like site-specific DNA recombinase